MDNLTDIQEHLRIKIGLDDSVLSKKELLRSISSRQNQLGIPNPILYFSYLIGNPKELNELTEELVVPETWFFRDIKTFEFIKSSILQKKLIPPLSILSVPSSTGEEPYSIAISLLESGLNKSQFYIEALDISQKAINKAKKGIYSKNSFRHNNFKDIAKYFHKKNDNEFHLMPEVLSTVNFRQANIMNDNFAKLENYDIIFCRNLMIYLDKITIDKFSKQLCNLLSPGGYLFVGSVESIHFDKRELKSLKTSSLFGFQKPPKIFTAKDNNNNKSTAPKNKQPPKSSNFKKSNNSLELETKSVLNLAAIRDISNRGDTEEAIRLCLDSLKETKLCFEIYLLLGELYHSISDDVLAETYFQKALYLNPYDIKTITFLLIIKQRNGILQEAEILKKRLERINLSNL